MPSLVSILNRSVFSVAFLVAGFCATAEAQDIADWQGAYWGIGAGGSYGTTSSNSQVLYNGGYFNNASGKSDAAQFNPILQRVIEGFDASGSLIAGYNIQSGNLIYGLEGDLTFANFDERKGVQDLTADTSPSHTVTISTRVESNYTASLRTRVGYATGNMLLALSAGPSLSTFKTTFDYEDTFTSNVTHIKQSKTKLGVSAGASAGYKLKDGWSVRGDYVFTYFPGIFSGTSDHNGDGKDDFDFDSDFQSHNLRLTLVRQF